MCEAMCLMMENKELREYYKTRSVCRAKDFSKDVIIGRWVEVLKGNYRGVEGNEADK